ncbi:hypothetical protein BKA70DRAFT_1108692, partial [Coprinopsis sp. MPI-PUGE-AT-0042]
MINNVTRTLVYLTRSNTDTTCLLSGTAVKGTLGYVSDYLVKQALKTYQIFSTARTVFERNEDLLTDDNEIDSGRKLILKVLNSLMAKMEIGGPMAAMYLLGNPDRYTSHDFVSFYWKNYVNRMLESWYSGGEAARGSALEADGEEEVVLNRWGKTVIGRSYVDNYTYRPAEYEDVNLYEWIQSHEIVTKASLPLESNKVGRKLYFEFQEGHSLHRTHAVTCTPERRGYIVPNFIGPALPRLGAGDDEYYACTMLCFFRPWRSGRDLKAEDATWLSEWEATELTPFQTKLLANFKLRYECYDARDDFSLRTRSRKDAEDRSDAGLEDEGLDDFVNDGQSAEERVLCEQDGPETLKRKEQMKIAEGVLEEAGWTREVRSCADGHSPSETMTDGDRCCGEGQRDGVFSAPRDIDPDEWRSIVKEERSRRLRDKQNGPSEDDTSGVGTTGSNSVRVVPGSFISDEYLIGREERMTSLQSISKDKTLNIAQDRAYQIVARHSLEVSPAQLVMYISGSAGTGKTQVIKALTAWFHDQKESAKLALLAPTGTAASQIGGSTWHYYLGIQTFDGGRVKKSTVKAIQEA